MSDHSYRILSPSPTSFKRTPTVSRLREHDKKNANLDWLVGLCAGSGAKTRIERMQEKRIFKILSAAPSPEPGTCGSSESSISSMLLSYAEEDPFVDRVCRPESPDPEWANEVGGNITGIRDAKPSVLKPWKEPNFGITFRYRLKDNEVFDDRKESQLPGNRSLYGGQWFRRECQPRMLYLPSPPSPVCSGCSDTSDGPLEMRRDRACKDWVFSGGYRRIRKGKDDIVDEARLEGLRIPSEPAKIIDHTLPSFALTGEHIHCFPDIAWPQRPRAGLNLERACAQYKEIGRLHKIYEEQQNMYVRTYNAATRVGPAAPSVPSSVDPQISNNKADIENGPLPKWVIRRQQVQAEYANNPQNNHRRSANYRSSSQLYTASQMIDEQAKKIQKQIAADREHEIITEQKKLAAQRQQAQHRVKAFKPDPKKSIIAQRAPKSKVGGRVVFTRPREMARPRGPIVKNEAVLAAERKAKVKEDDNSSTKGIEQVLDAMSQCKVKTEEKASVAADEDKENVKQAASTMAELNTKAKKMEEEITNAIDKLKANAEKVEEDVTKTIDELKNAIEIVRPSTGEASAEKATDSCQDVLKEVSQITQQAVEKEAIDTSTEYCNKLNTRVGKKKYGNDCAVDSDSEEEWDPKWIVERPRRYSMEHRNSHLY